MKKIYVKIINFLATACYAGYLPKAPGTWGSLLAVALYWLVFRHFGLAVFGLFIIAAGAVGILVSGEYDRLHGTHDASEIVIDEVVGQSMVLMLVAFVYDLTKYESPEALWCWEAVIIYLGLTIAGFLLFRFLDIVKPLGIKQIQALPGGWGVMLDDVLAGLYAAGAAALIAVILGTLYYG